MIKNSMFLPPNDLETRLSKLKDKWVEEFDSKSNLSGDNMCTWIVDYVNLNHNVSISISKARDDLIQIKKRVFEMKIKKVIIAPLMWDYIFVWVEKELIVVTETTQP